MSENVSLLFAVFGAFILWTTTVAGVVLWLATRFRSLEAAIYKETRRVEDKLDKVETRTQRVELKVFGFTHTDQSIFEKL